VFPTLHYQNGGIEINEFAQVLDGNSKPIPGLFAGGEVEGGVHGKNRLMGNSLLDFNVFGKRAGISAAEYVKNGVKPGKPTFKHVEKYTRELKTSKIKEERKSPMILPEYRGKQVLARSIDIID